MAAPTPSFAYLFERFPSFVQTFVYREAVEMVRQGMAPLLVSIRPPDDPAELLAEMQGQVFQMPPAAEIRATTKLPRLARWMIPRERREKDVNRLFEALWLAPILKQHGIRHVHAHFGGMAARTAWWLKKLGGFTYSFTGHANDIFCENEFPVSNADLVAGARFVVTETDYARLWMEEKYPRAKGKIFRVFNGIDRDFPPREEAGPVPRILSVGRYVEKKGFGDLIEACRLLRERGVVFECQIVGGGPMEAELQAQIERAGVGDCVRLLGPRPQSEVRRLMAGARLFVLACVPESAGGSDNLPTVIMEAMMCGVPVISTRLAGVPEMIVHGENGLLVEPHAAQALSEAMETLLGDSVRGEKMALKARESAHVNFAIETTTRALKHLLVRKGRVAVPAGAWVKDEDLPRGGWKMWGR